MEINKDQPNETNKAIYSEPAIARESGTITCILAETQMGRGVGKFHSRTREGFDVLLKAVSMGKLQAVLLKEKHPMQLVRGAYLSFSGWCLIGTGNLKKKKKAVSY